ncbi:MAG: CocE/NonD family hydrolase [Myxococcota bacterium]
MATHDSSIPARTRALRGYGSLTIKPLSPDIAVERDVVIQLRDGTAVRANLFRPARVMAPLPVLVHCVPYGKDDTPKRGSLWDRWNPQYRLMRTVLGGDIGELTLSEATPWEAIDPNVWCAKGYIVVACDSRGFGKSDVAGKGSRRPDAPPATLVTPQEAQDFHDVVEWCAAQPFCNGRVGSIGVSYLAISQWAMLGWAQPPSLKAAVLWEGVVNLLRHLFNQGGAGPSRFAQLWTRATRRLARGGTRNFGQDLLGELDAMAEARGTYRVTPTMAAMNPPIERIDPDRTALLICGSWSDQGIHNPGTFWGWRRVVGPKGARPHTFLVTHGRRKWEAFYDWAEPILTRFLDHYLKESNPEGEPALPRVRLELRDDETKSWVRDEAAFPPARTVPTPISFNPAMLAPGRRRTLDGATVVFDARLGEAVFVYTFTEDTEVCGFARLTLHVSLDDPKAECDDAIVVAQLHKVVPGEKGEMRRVAFPGVMGDRHEGVSRGYLRLSHHVGHDEALSTALQPHNRHDRAEPLQQNQIVTARIALNPSATRFRQGDELHVIITGKETASTPMLKRLHLDDVNEKGLRLRIYLDDGRAPVLALPVLPDDGRQRQLVLDHNPT